MKIKCLDLPSPRTLGHNHPHRTPCSCSSFAPRNRESFFSTRPAASLEEEQRSPETGQKRARSKKNKRGVFWKSKLTFLFTLLFFYCSSMAIAENLPLLLNIPQHLWTSVLQNYVTGDGLVDYAALQSNRTLFDRYISALEKIDPSHLAELRKAKAKDKRAKQEWMALWINAYNALAIQIVLDHYPLKSTGHWQSHESKVTSQRAGKEKISLFERGAQFLFERAKRVENGFSTRPAASLEEERPPHIEKLRRVELKVAGESVSLDQIEHQILRKEGDPRIHFAIVCASKGSPKLRRKAYLPETLDAQLEEATHLFFKEKKNYFIDRDARILCHSKILTWFAEDFENKRGSLIPFINRYVPLIDQQFIETDIDTPACRLHSFQHLRKGCVRPIEYDWTLNDSNFSICGGLPFFFERAQRVEKLRFSTRYARSNSKV